MTSPREVDGPLPEAADELASHGGEDETEEGEGRDDHRCCGHAHVEGSRIGRQHRRDDAEADGDDESRPDEDPDLPRNGDAVRGSGRGCHAFILPPSTTRPVVEGFGVYLSTILGKFIDVTITEISVYRRFTDGSHSAIPRIGRTSGGTVRTGFELDRGRVSLDRPRVPQRSSAACWRGERSGSGLGQRDRAPPPSLLAGLPPTSPNHPTGAETERRRTCEAPGGADVSSEGCDVAQEGGITCGSIRAGQHPELRVARCLE